ncbi:MAG: hypothetical protein LZF60_340043 [Nitrospira sp.]|nr:hypothetical protein [Nitrospira sp.]ULA61503.1 MAG: hypothetical protein LZF60_340043 [Nitrospira sp.]
MTDDRLAQALALFALSQPYTLEQLNRQRDTLLHTWTPRRFANLTNNPKKYMQAYTKAEEMTRKIEEAHLLLTAALDHQRS